MTDRPEARTHSRATDSQAAEAARQARIGVIIPAYRVAAHIAQVVREIPPYVAEIFVIDDASPDDIAGAISNISDPRVTLVKHDQNQGVGGAVMTGYERAANAGCTILVKVDGDGQMDTGRMLDLVEPLLDGRADYAKGNRFLHSAELRAMPFFRRVGNIGLTFLAKAASGYWTMFDPANGYTAMHVDVWRKLNPRRIAKRYFFESSLLIELGCRRAVVEDVAIPARYQGEISSLSPVKVVLEFPPRLLMGLLRRLGTCYFLYDFTPVSLFLTWGILLSTFAVVWGGYFWRRSIETGIANPTGTVMIAVVSLVLGVQLLLQAIALDIQNVPRDPIQQPRRGR